MRCVLRLFVSVTCGMHNKVLHTVRPREGKTSTETAAVHTEATQTVQSLTQYKKGICCSSLLLVLLHSPITVFAVLRGFIASGWRRFLKQSVLGLIVLYRLPVTNQVGGLPKVSRVKRVQTDHTQMELVQNLQLTRFFMSQRQTGVHIFILHTR